MEANSSESNKSSQIKRRRPTEPDQACKRNKRPKWMKEFCPEYFEQLEKEEQSAQKIDLRIDSPEKSGADDSGIISVFEESLPSTPKKETGADKSLVLVLKSR